MGAALGSAILTLVTDANPLEAGLASALGSVQTWAALATRAIEDAAGAIVSLGSQYQAQFARIEGLTGVATDQVGLLKEAVIDLVGEVGKTPEELGAGLYYILSSGINDAALAMDVLRQSAMAAAAGLGTTQQIADAVTSTMNAYGQSTYTASQITDILVAAVREGKGEADELAASIGKILPIASMAGVSFEQVAAAVATMTRGGLEANSATIYLRQALQSMVAPTAQAKKELAALGLSADEVRRMLGEEGLAATLQLLMERTGGSIDSLDKLFGNIRGLTAVLALGGAQAQEYADVLRAMEEAGGSTANAFDKITKTLEFQGQRWDAIWQGIGAAIGSQVEPQLAGLVGRINDFLVQNLLRLDFGAIAADLGGGFQSIWANIQATVEGVAGQAQSWGLNITSALADGMAMGLNLIADVINAIASLLSFWLAPGSPPRVAPYVDKWGEALSSEFVGGMSAGMVSGLNEFAKMAETEIRNAFAMSGGGGDALYDAIAGTRSWLPRAIDDVRQFGMVGAEAMDGIRSAAGDLSDEIIHQAELYGDLLRLTEEREGLERTLLDLKRAENAELRPIKNEQDKIRLQLRQLQIQEELGRLQQNQAKGKASPQDQQQYELKKRQLELEMQANDIQLKRQDEIQQAQDRVDAIKDEEGALKDQIDVYKGQNQWVSDNIRLWNEFHQAVGGAGGGGGAAGALGAAAQGMRNFGQNVQNSLAGLDLAKERIGAIGAAFQLLFTENGDQRLNLASIIEEAFGHDRAAQINSLTSAVRGFFKAITGDQSGLAQLRGGLADAFGPEGEQKANNIINAIQNVQQAAATAGPIIQQFGQWVGKMLDPQIPWEEKQKDIEGGIKKLGVALSGALKTMADDPNTQKNVASVSETILTQLFNALDTIIKTTGQIAALMGSLANALLTWAQNNHETIGKIGGEIAAGILEGATKALADAIPKIDWGGIFMNNFAWVDVVGKPIGDAIKSGILAAIQGLTFNVWDFITNKPPSPPVGGNSSGGNSGAAVEAGGATSGARALGGPVLAGQSYLVGEHGPEILTPATNGYITPNGALMPTAFHQTLNIGPGVDPVATREAARQGFMQGMRDFLAAGRGRQLLPGGVA